MILMSNKDMDTAFVAKAIQEHNLDPKPKHGFHAESSYWVETTRWKRVIELYDWGAAMFIADRQRNAAATLVAVGKLDIENGRVSQQGGWQDIQPGWYKEMAMELRDQKRNHAQLAIPPCLGFRQPDHICDGGRNPQTNKMEPPCAWRERCMALQSFADENKRTQEDLLKSKSPEQIVQLTTRLLERKGGVKPAKAAPAAKPVKREEATSGTPANAAPTSGPSKVTMDVVSGIAREVAEAAGLKVSPDYTKATAGNNDLYTVDRTINSDYISLYQARKPRPLALASFRLRSRVGMLVQLPLPKGSPLLGPIVPDDVKEWKDGAFQSAIREVPLQGNRLEHVKHILVSILKQS